MGLAAAVTFDVVDFADVPGAGVLGEGAAVGAGVEAVVVEDAGGAAVFVDGAVVVGAGVAAWDLNVGVGGGGAVSSFAVSSSDGAGF